MARKRKSRKRREGFSKPRKRAIKKMLKAMNHAHRTMCKAHEDLIIKVERVTAMLEDGDFIQS